MAGSQRGEREWRWRRGEGERGRRVRIPLGLVGGGLAGWVVGGGVWKPPRGGFIVDFFSFVLNKFWYEVLFVKYIHVVTVWVRCVGLYCDSYKVGGLF